MSTRAIIHIFDKRDGFYIYLHWDSTPKRVSQAVDKAKKFSWEVSRFEACEFATALIKILKDKAWWVYLSNTTEQLSNMDYYYSITEKLWDIEIKTTSFNK